MIIIQDTREQNPFSFAFYECETTVATLKTGDYTLQGYEEIVAIERKKSTSELATNLGKYRDRFEREMERLSEFEHKYIVCEFTESDLLQFPLNSSIPKRIIKYIRMNGKFMRKQLHKYEEEYGVAIIFCDGKEEAESKVVDIFKEITRQYE
jgi:DNA excision repair protein ERCC-4